MIPCASAPRGVKRSSDLSSSLSFDLQQRCAHPLIIASWCQSSHSIEIRPNGCHLPPLLRNLTAVRGLSTAVPDNGMGYPGVPSLPCSRNLITCLQHAMIANLILIAR
jgi:hypothetical protein